MKVAFDHQIFSAQRYGGISRYFVELAQAMLCQTDDPPVVKIASVFYRNEYLKNARRELNFTGYYCSDSPFTNKAVKYGNNLLTPLSLARFSPEIIHETYYSGRGLGPASSRRVLTVYDMIHELYPEQFPSRDATTEFKKAAIDRADHIICISENTRKDLIQHFDIDEQKTSAIHLGFTQQNQKKDLPNDVEKPFLLYVGARDGYKNFSRFLEAYARSQKIRNHFDVKAFGGGRFSSRERKMIRSLKISEACITQISGSDELLANCYRQAALFVYPSLYEGFGIPPLEAMSFGCPVLCSDTSSIPEVVGNAAFLFEPDSLESFVHGLDRALFNFDDRRQVIELGFERIRKFSWDKCAVETLAVYRGITK